MSDLVCECGHDVEFHGADGACEICECRTLRLTFPPGLSEEEKVEVMRDLHKRITGSDLPPRIYTFEDLETLSDPDIKDEGEIG